MSTLATLLADPYSIHDTSGGDPRLHAYRRIALAAHAMGLDAAKATQDALFALGYPRRNGKPARSIDDLTVVQCEAVAGAFERALDARMS